MAKLTEELWKTLQELTIDEFKNFKWFLKQDEVLEGFIGIAPAQLETAERHDTVDLMLQKYLGGGALKVTLEILEKISRNDLVQVLLKTTSELKDPKNHQSVTPKSDYDGKKAELGDRIKHMIEERQMKIEEIKRSAELSCKSAARHIADSERVFDILLQSVKRSLTDLTDAINKKHKQTQKQADRFIEELEQEISELTKESKKIEQLSSTTDYVELLQMFPSLSAAPSANNWTELTVTPPSYGRDMRTIVKHLEEDICKENEKLIAKVKLNRAREFAKDVTLDAETANPYLVLSDDGKQVYCGDLKQKLTDGPERFNAACNVLGKQSVSSGRFYFEVQVEGMSSWDLGVVKESIQRKGSTAASPENGYWTICLRDSHRLKAYAVHLDVKCLPKKVGVFVDYEKGSVCFYDVDSTNLIHRVTDCSFSERLYPFFSPGCHYGSKNFTPMIIYAVNYND